MTTPPFKICFIMNPIITLIYNTTAHTWHPIVFLEYPLPGDANIIRHKSEIHHTTGFASRDEAINSIPQLAGKVKELWGTPRTCLDREFQWDGEGVPALVEFFQDIDNMPFVKTVV